ncbi:hypothetical protein B0A49_07434 [Cryomyces minteri]|uniref:GRIP domain-containing protein n=1 Tax=Cryomyces minteri TaxID=331657 RepID=A0A4U0WWX0_9PEZI|nr:hypothetical protein B0A49_07434 [Cryomyces minteri]
MSAVSKPESVNPPTSKKKNKKKKSKATKSEDTADPAKTNGTEGIPEHDVEDAEGEGDEPESPRAAPEEPPTEEPLTVPSPLKPAVRGDEPPESNGTREPEDNNPPTNATSTTQAPQASEVANSSKTSERLEALARERDSLRLEVTELRRSLETIQEKHQEDLARVRAELEDSQSGKEHAEIQYRNLLGKVNTIKSQLGERLKADAEEISQARAQIEKLEDQSRSLRETNESLQANLTKISAESEHQAQEISTLRSRTNLSQQNWAKERDDLANREAYAREEFEAAKQAMQDWEVLAMEERLLRESLSDRMAELEEQLSSQREAYERAASERDTHSLTVDGLQRALQDIQDARKRELREMVEQTQSQFEDLRKQVQVAEEAASSSRTSLEATHKELERALPFEREVKEKNLLIGKLRHEAVILDDHLTKALRFLKKGKPEDNVDRQIVTNHLLHFLALDRSDPKKFQVLQLIAALLSWSDEQREAAGLARPGASNSSLRIPLSPFRRTPSTPSLSAEFMPESPAGTSKESLAELWNEFLEREAQEGGAASRQASVAGQGARSPGG